MGPLTTATADMLGLRIRSFLSKYLIIFILIGLVALLATFLFYGFRVLRLPSDDPNSELIAGLLAAVVASCVHLYYEWIFMTFTLHYLFAIGTGMMVGIGVRMKMGAKVRLPRTSALTAVPQLG
jgi:hypothetical protein